MSVEIGLYVATYPDRRDHANAAIGVTDIRSGMDVSSIPGKSSDYDTFMRLLERPNGVDAAVNDFLGR